jgi:hypothetical protein
MLLPTAVVRCVHLPQVLSKLKGGIAFKLFIKQLLKVVALHTHARVWVAAD